MYIFKKNEIVSYLGKRVLVLAALEEEYYKIKTQTGEVRTIKESSLETIYGAPFFCIGDKVKIIHGVAEGRVGTITSIDFSTEAKQFYYKVDILDEGRWRCKGSSLELGESRLCDYTVGDIVAVINSKYVGVFQKALEVKAIYGRTIEGGFNGLSRFAYQSETEKSADKYAFSDGDYAVLKNNQIGVVKDSYESRFGYCRVVLPTRGTTSIPADSLKKIDKQKLFVVNSIVLYHSNISVVVKEKEEDRVDVYNLTTREFAVDLNKYSLVPYAVGEKVDKDQTDGVLPCSSCGKLEPVDTLNYVEGAGLVCKPCYIDNTYECFHCGTRHSLYAGEELLDYQENRICEHCAQSAYSCCSDCGRYFEPDGNDYCPSCYEEYDTCACCGRISRDVYDGMCRDCLDNFIHDYSFKPKAVFYGQPEDKKFFGLEWEIGQGGQDAENAMSILGGKKELYCKEDGSVEEGFEVVTHPLSVAYHLNELDWESLLQRAKHLDYEGIPGTGIHIHVSREALPEDAIANLIYFFEREWDSLVHFASRTEDETSRWADRYLRGNDLRNWTPKQSLKYAIDRHDRYRAVNLRNRETVEIRIFRSTCNPLVMKSYIQFTDIITDLAKDSVVGETYSFKEIMALAAERGYEELVKYLPVRLPHLKLA